MTRTLLCLSALAAAAVAVPAFAQTTPTTPEPPTMSAPGEGLAVDQAVNDNAGVTIGKITALAPDASGKTMATITMPEGSFAVDSKALVVLKGAAVINMKQADLQAQVKAAAPAAAPAETPAAPPKPKS